jgi:hypothetical protein
MESKGAGHSSGAIAALRRRGLPLASKLLTWLAAFLLLGWGAGAFWTDEHRITQYLWWLPMHWVLAAAWSLVALAWMLERVSLRLGGVQLRSIITVVLLGLTVWMLVGMWNVHRAAWWVLSPRGPGDVRVVYWNMTVGRELNGAVEQVLAEAPDLAIIANPRTDGLRGTLLRGLGEIGQSREAEEPEDTGLDVGPTRFLFRHEIAVATRGEIVRWGSVRFVVGEPDDEFHRGVVMFVEIAGLEPTPIVVWVVDLPSHAGLWRAEVTAVAMESILDWAGPDMRRDAIGQWVPHTTAGEFPQPDLIVGDFNIPRGSASLRTLVGRRVEAHASGGWGPGMSWNRGWPGWAIDLLFAGDGWLVQHHRVVDPQMGMHRMIVVDLKRDGHPISEQEGGTPANPNTPGP